MAVKMKVVQGKPHNSILDFPAGEFVVGRGPECQVRPNSELVSRQHCLLRIDGQAIRVRDLGSTNGTLVNGKRLLGECTLVDGDTVQLGPLVLQVVLTEEEAPTLADDTAAYATLADTSVMPAHHPS